MTKGLLLSSSNVNLQSSVVAAAFHAFNLEHLATLGVIAVLCFLITVAARKGKGTEQKWLRYLIGFALLAYVAFFYIQQGVEGVLAWEYSLPLELCNMVLAACIISMFCPNTLTAEIAYFWGLGGTLHALITPDLAQDFPSLNFMFFFLSHGMPLIAIVYLIASGSLRPRRGAILRMMVSLNLYGLVVGMVNLYTGWNYGYLCRKPAVPSLLDFLGPWPWYLVSIELIALLTFLILDLPRRSRTFCFGTE
jgi:hypothetical integral membrane protein (TIGR02206 family)